MQERTIQLTDIVDKDHLQKLQDTFAAATNITTTIVDPDARRITQASNWGGFCALLYDSEQWGGLCADKIKELTARAGKTQKPVILPCPHLGLTTAAVPILVDGMYLGSWIIGQFRIGTEREELPENAAEKYGLTEEAARELLEKMPLFSMEDFQRLFAFLQSLTGTIVELGHNNLKMRLRDKELRHAAQQMELRDRALTAFCQSSADLMYICDFYTGEMLMANEAFSALTGLPLEEIIGKKCWSFSDSHAEHFCGGCPRVHLLTREDDAPTPYVREHYNKIYKKWFRCTHQTLTWGAGRAAQLIAAKDVTQERELIERLENLAFYDSLTSLPNNHMLAQHAIEATNEGASLRSHLICFDVSQIRLFSDAHGRDLGEGMLRAIVAWLKAEFVENSALYCLRSFEFCLALKNVEPETAEEAARRISERFETPWRIKVGDDEISYICGVTVSLLLEPLSMAAPAELPSLISRTLLRAKESKGIFVYNEEMDKEVREGIKLSMSLKDCVNRGMAGFSLNYQPIVDIASGIWKGLEALCRWTSPSLGFVSPLVFIREAEKRGLITAVGDWVLETSVRRCKELKLDAVEGFFLSVNISPVQMMDGQFADKVLALIKRHRFPGRCLNLEVTESAEMTFGNFTMDMIERLRAEGITLALDDFGTGYSSFNNLKHLPVQYLKTEREFILGIEDDTYMQYFLYIMSEIAHANGKKLIAEGIETIDQLRIVRNNGADFIQGYFFSKPLPSGDLEEKLDRFACPDNSFVVLSADIINIKQWLSGKSAYELTPAIFNLLNQSTQILLMEEDTRTAIQSVLEFVGEHYRVSRAFVFVRQKKSVYSNLYEWCEKGVSPQKDMLLGIDVKKDTPSLVEAFRSEGMIVASDISKLPEDLYAALHPLGVASNVLMPMWDDTVLEGFVGFEKEMVYEWSPEEVVVLWNLAMLMASTLKRDKLQTEIQEKTVLLEKALKTSGLNAFVTDLETDEILWANASLLATYPDDRQIVGRKCHEVFLGTPDRCPHCIKGELLESPGAGQGMREIYNSRLGRNFLVHDHLIRWKGGRLAHIGYSLDVTDRRNVERQLAYFSTTEIQSGALNKKTITRHMEEMLKEAWDGNEPMALVFLNIDRLKKISEKHGLDVGDAVVANTVVAIKTCIHGSDLVGRITGDEFLVLLPNCSSSTARMRMMEARNYLARLQGLPEGLKPTFSYGIAESSEITRPDGGSAIQLLRTAQQRMRRNKKRMFALAQCLMSL